MSWASAEEIRNQVERRWKNGDVLRALVNKSDIFPLELRVRIPSSREMAMDFARAQEWMDMLRSLPGVRIVWGSVRSRTLGHQPIPESLWIDTVDQAIAHLQRKAEAERFLRLHQETERTLPKLLPWIEENPIRTLSVEQIWERLLQVVAWKESCPDIEPIYVRQVDLPGIDTKFIENNGTILSELFNSVLPPGPSLDQTKDFRVRHGFLREPIRIRFRLLDPTLHFAGLTGCPDVELDEDSFAALHLPVRRLFATENKTNFLAFPHIENSAILFTAGYGMRALGRARWIENLPLYYWGDIDTHGFAILSQLRDEFPHTLSFLMDEETLMHHRSSWTSEQSASRHSVLNLSISERRVFEKLLPEGSWYQARLEQEKVSQVALRAALCHLLEQERQ
jgi:hypothetical protein